jgi:2-(1,2-epoxy-1,2-dihydrophenyl)acetyl-CoA isomerase
MGFADAKYEFVECQQHGAVALIAYNRPDKRNAWNVPIIRETIDAFKRANADDSVRAIVLTGNGPAYCAGADIKAPPEPPDENGRRPHPATLTMGKGDHNWLRLMADSKPNIIAVNGPAVGIGVTHILAADVRIAAESATFAFPFLRLGAMPECGATGLLPRLVGYGRALNLCLQSATINAQEAERIGLVSSVHPDAGLREAAITMAAKFAAYPPLQVKLTRKMFQENAEEDNPDEILRRENTAFMEMLRTLKRDKPLG